MIKSFNNLVCVPPIHLWLMHHPRMCAPANAWLPTASTIYHLGLFRKKKVQVASPSYVQSKAQMDEPFPKTIGGYFECLHVSHYGARLAEEKRRTILIFDHFRFTI